MFIIFVLLTFFFNTSQSFILRHPNCRFVANYSTILREKYFESRDVTAGNASGKDCSMQCTMNTHCLFYNQNIQSGRCELINSRNGSFIDRPGWRFISTDYDEWKYRGPFCRFMRPQCAFEKEFCVDICNGGSSDYKCELLENIALKKLTKESSYYSSSGRSDAAVDGSGRGFASKQSSFEWLLVDLAKVYKIIFLVYRNVINPRHHAKYITVRIGNKEDVNLNDVCVAKQDYSKEKQKTIVCRHGSMVGRYVYFIKEDTPNYTLNVKELYVYGF